MLLSPSKVLRVEIGFALIVLPLVIWLALCLAARWWSLNLRPALPWLKTLRFIGWGFGVVLFSISLARDHFPWSYGVAMFTFSAGLSFPESWIKRRFAPELLESDQDWWPSRN